MTLPEIKAEIVSRRLAGQDCSPLIVLCQRMEVVANKHTQIQRILDDPDAVDRLCEDDAAMERFLEDL